MNFQSTLGEVDVYRTESALLDDFVKCLARTDTPWGRVRVAREFFYQRGRADVIALAECGRVLAFEGKLSRWRTALHQAYKNTCFAHSSYVLLPEDVARVALNYATEFNRRGIGLCTVAGDELLVLEEAKETEPLQAWLAQEATMHASDQGNGSD